MLLLIVNMEITTMSLSKRRELRKQFTLSCLNLTYHETCTYTLHHRLNSCMKLWPVHCSPSRFSCWSKISPFRWQHHADWANFHGSYPAGAYIVFCNSVHLLESGKGEAMYAKEVNWTHGGAVSAKHGVGWNSSVLVCAIPVLHMFETSIST